MKRLMLLCVTAFAVAGCGPNFNGTFSGTLFESGSCSDGSSGSDSYPITWRLVDNGDRIVITPEAGTCGSYEATPSGATADISAKDCPPYNGGGYIYADTISSGTLTVDGDTLTVGFSVTTAVGGIATGFCSTTYSATLARE